MGEFTTFNYLILFSFFKKNLSPENIKLVKKFIDNI